MFRANPVTQGGNTGYSGATSSGTVVSFPIAFSNTKYTVIGASGFNSSNGATTPTGVNVYTTSQFKVVQQYLASGAVVPGNSFWYVAVGN